MQCHSFIQNIPVGTLANNFAICNSRFVGITTFVLKVVGGFDFHCNYTTFSHCTLPTINRFIWLEGLRSSIVDSMCLYKIDGLDCERIHQPRISSTTTGTNYGNLIVAASCKAHYLIISYDHGTVTMSNHNCSSNIINPMRLFNYGDLMMCSDRAMISGHHSICRGLTSGCSLVGFAGTAEGHAVDHIIVAEGTADVALITLTRINRVTFSDSHFVKNTFPGTLIEEHEPEGVTMESHFARCTFSFTVDNNAQISTGDCTVNANADIPNTRAMKCFTFTYTAPTISKVPKLILLARLFVV